MSCQISLSLAAQWVGYQTVGTARNGVLSFVPDPQVGEPHTGRMEKRVEVPLVSFRLLRFGHRLSRPAHACLTFDNDDETTVCRVGSTVQRSLHPYPYPPFCPCRQGRTTVVV